MPTSTNAEMLEQTVEAVFLTMMNLEVLPDSTSRTPSPDQLTSAVHLSGSWNGALLFECGRPQACQFAGRILSIDPPDTVTDEVRDVLGELANMIGGNMKNALAEDVVLSMPSVTEGCSELRICGSKVQDRLAFTCSDGPFWVTLLAERPAPGGER